MRANPRCPQCSGPGVLMGTLGWLRWFRCRDCGWEFSRKIKRKTKKV